MHNDLVYSFNMPEVFNYALTNVWGKDGKNWTQDQYETVGRYCLVGGIARALRYTHADEHGDLDQDYFTGGPPDDFEELCETIVTDLNRLLMPLVKQDPARDMHAGGYKTITDWNDGPWRDFDDVRDLLNKATDQIKNQQFNGSN